MSDDTRQEPTEQFCVTLTPKRRDDALVVVDAAGEMVVYDKRSRDAHVLNPAMAAVWQHCDGVRTATAIAALLEQTHGIPASSGAVWAALEQLEQAGLLERQAVSQGVTITRRSVLRTIATAGVVALPALASLAVPAAAAAASCLQNGAACTTNQQCCSDICDTIETHTCVAGVESDRNRKEHVQPVDPVAVLSDVARLPIATWNYIGEDPAVRHMGPMAQDFAAAFGLGEDDRHIHVVDTAGVALASIQALAALVHEQERQLGLLRAELSRLGDATAVCTA